jgi:predicted O-linked N-acetylglucosamine transferase (SPINDLY family)
MGVPVVSLVGDRHVSRVGASLLAAAGHPEWSTYTTDAYAAKAAQLARVALADSQTRQGLRSTVAASALLDAGRFTVEFAEAIVQALDPEGERDRAAPRRGLLQ